MADDLKWLGKAKREARGSRGGGQALDIRPKALILLPGKRTTLKWRGRG